MLTRFLRTGEPLPWRLAVALAFALAVTAGCDDDGHPPAGRRDAGIDAEVPVDSGIDAEPVDAGTDGGTDGGGVRRGMLGRSGTATATLDGYAGNDEIFFLADEGNGPAICRITYALTSTAAAEGCTGCLWAFELEISGAEVAEETDVGCLATVGIDPAHVGDLDGTTVDYGFDPAYVGHASVLMSRTETGEWAPDGYANWDEATGAFDYRRVDGNPTY